MAFPFDVWIDRSLNVVHSNGNCSGLTIPRKYGDIERISVRTIEQARELDERYRACDGCKADIARKRGTSTRQHRYTKREQPRRI